jgi:hypothetical protein
MAAYDPEFRRRPEQFVRGRSWPRTLVILAFALACVIALVYTLVNFAVLQSNAADATGSVRYVAGQRIGLIAAPIVLPLFAAGFVFAAVRFGRVWSLAPTGTRLRRRHYRSMSGGRPLFDDLLARLRTGDPSRFTPLPPQPSHADVEIEFWTAADDRVGFATLTLHEGPGGKTLSYSEPVPFTGASFDALSAALTAGLDAKASPPAASGTAAPGPSAPGGPSGPAGPAS